MYYLIMRNGHMTFLKNGILIYGNHEEWSIDPSLRIILSSNGILMKGHLNLSQLEYSHFWDLEERSFNPS